MEEEEEEAERKAEEKEDFRSEEGRKKEWSIST